MITTQTVNTIYYQLKPFLPRWFQLWLRRRTVNAKRKKYSAHWPILHTAGVQPNCWKGWPEKKRFAVVLTHDVESEKGLANCLRVAQMEMALGFRSSFNFVAQRYQVPDTLRYKLKSKGFEIGVHGVYHDGKLFQSRTIFAQRAKIINRYLAKWKAVGFRSPAMHHNLEWLHELDICYDLSTFDTDPFEPQPDGVSTIFPFWVKHDSSNHRYLEMPYTLAQDFTLFVLMKEKSTRLWRDKLDWIVTNGGMALLNTHPDYMSFNGKSNGIDTYPAERYLDFLQYVKSMYKELYWQPLPKDVVMYYNKLST
ncbi:MAG: hypothetical protein GY874_02555 [Desulfobacteraceae bacterium]|nr:hypothetical protein [Desulfobacteraceae bacterium]